MDEVRAVEIDGNEWIPHIFVLFSSSSISTWYQTYLLLVTAPTTTHRPITTTEMTTTTAVLPTTAMTTPDLTTRTTLQTRTTAALTTATTCPLTTPRSLPETTTSLLTAEPSTEGSADAGTWYHGHSFLSAGRMYLESLGTGYFH